MTNTKINNARMVARGLLWLKNCNTYTILNTPSGILKMNILKTIIEAVTATTVMTVFVHSVGGFTAKRVQVIPILGTMLTNETTPLKRLSFSRKVITTGTLAHYLVGFIFALMFEWGWRKGIIVPTVLSALPAGIVIGLFAIGVWRSFITLHPNPPSIALPMFLFAIFLGHIIFSLGITITHQFLTQYADLTGRTVLSGT